MIFAVTPSIIELLLLTGGICPFIIAYLFLTKRSYCPECHKMVRDNAATCPKCGNDLSAKLPPHLESPP